jgi:hypothetical protein
LWELKFGIVGIHGTYLLAGGCAKDLDNFDKLIDARVAGEEWLAEEELSANASYFWHRIQDKERGEKAMRW